MFLELFEGEEPDVSLEPGQTLFEENDKAETMYVIRSGHIDLSVKGVELTSIMEDEIVGEMALVDDSARFARAVAGGDGARLHSLDKSRFLEMLKDNPDFAIKVMSVMAYRLRKWGEIL